MGEVIIGRHVGAVAGGALTTKDKGNRVSEAAAVVVVVVVVILEVVVEVEVEVAEEVVERMNNTLGPPSSHYIVNKSKFN